MLAACATVALAIGVAQAPGARSEEAAALQPRVENNPADKSYPVNCGHACQAKMARAKEQRMGGNKVGRAIKSTVNLFAPSSLEHPPHFHIDGKETRLFLKSGSETPLLTFPTSGGMLSLVGSTTGREVDEWFESFSLVTDNSKAAVNIQAGKPLSADMPTKTLGVRVDGEPLPHAGLQASHRAMGVAVMARALPDKSEDGEAVEEVTIWSPEFELTVTSDKHSTGRHLNMKMNALPPGATGLLAELAGAQPMSTHAKLTQVAPEKAERKTDRVQAKAEQANEAMQDAEVKVEEAQKAIRKAHLKGAEAKEAASFDETVLANRAQEGRVALKNATKFRHRRHARKVAARIAAANGGEAANGKKMPKFGPEGRADDFPNEPYTANLSKTVDLKQMQAKRAAKKAQRKLKLKMQEEAKAAHDEAQAEETEKKAGAAIEAHLAGAGKASKKKAHLMKELPSPSPMPAVITTDPVGDAAAAAAAPQGEKSLPGCHSIALISDSWCTNNCLMGNCPKDMCSDECFADPVVEELRSNETSADGAKVEEVKIDDSECRSINEAIASDSWCMSSCSLGNCPATICSVGCKDQPQEHGPALQQQQESGKKISPSPSPAPKSSKHSALWLAKHASEAEARGKTKHSALWLAKHASKTQEKQEKATVVVKQEKAEVLPAPKPRTVGQELKETVQLKANLTMTEARELAQKVEMLKLDLRKVGPHGIFKKASEKKETEEGASYDAESGSVMVDESESKKLKVSTKAASTKSASTSKTSSTKASKPTSKLRKAGGGMMVPVPSPQPSPEPEADEEAAPDAGADDIDRSVDAEGCHSLSASLASDDWCMSNCALGNCPLTMCSTDCSSLKSGKSSGSAAAATTKELVTEGGAASDDGLEACRSIGDGPVDDGWCVSNCALGNCPETKCSEGCLRPGKGGASKKPAQNSASAPAESPAPSTGGKHAAQAASDDEQQQDAQEQKEHLVDVPVPSSKATSKNVVKKSSKKGSSKVEVWGADVVHPKKATVDAFLRGEDKA